MFAEKLKCGDEIRVIAPSRSLSVVYQEIFDSALEFLTSKGFKVTFSKNAREINEYGSSSIQSRVSDLQDAFLDKNVKAILTCIGGCNVNQILKHIDYSIIQQNPKILCGFSDITALINAIYAKTGLVTYHGPNFCNFGFPINIDYTNKMFLKCVSNDEPYLLQASNEAEKYYCIQEGECEGEIIGGNLCTLNLLQGTEFMPDIKDKVLFIEDNNVVGDYFCREFDRNLQSLLHIYNADTIKGIVFGRFEESCKMSAEAIAEIIKEKIAKDIPVIYNVDFGHVSPMATFPIGGKVRISARPYKVQIEVIKH